MGIHFRYGEMGQLACQGEFAAELKHVPVEQIIVLQGEILCAPDAKDRLLLESYTVLFTDSITLISVQTACTAGQKKMPRKKHKIFEMIDRNFINASIFTSLSPLKRNISRKIPT